MRNKLILSFLIISFTYIGLSFLSKPDSNCVNLYVDFGSLNAKTKVEKCIDISAETNALELLKISGYTTEGTQKYGDAVICRLNGLPDKSVDLRSYATRRCLLGCHSKRKETTSFLQRVGLGSNRNQRNFFI